MLTKTPVEKLVPTISEQRLRELLRIYMEPSGAGVLQVRATLSNVDSFIPRLQAYLDLLLRWNARTNLTAILDPEEIVRRHFGESLFAGGQIASLMGDGQELLDFGSGAGFPGLPIQLLLPEVRVVLAESQGKKAAFLREAVRVLGVSTQVWSGRVESMPQERSFEVVTLRAVDQMEAASAKAWSRVKKGGWRVELRGGYKAMSGGAVQMPGLDGGFVLMEQRS